MEKLNVVLDSLIVRQLGLMAKSMNISRAELMRRVLYEAVRGALQGPGGVPLDAKALARRYQAAPTCPPGYDAHDSHRLLDCAGVFRIVTIDTDTGLLVSRPE